MLSFHIGPFHGTCPVCKKTFEHPIDTRIEWNQGWCRHGTELNTLVGSTPIDNTLTRPADGGVYRTEEHRFMSAHLVECDDTPKDTVLMGSVTRDPLTQEMHVTSAVRIANVGNEDMARMEQQLKQQADGLIPCPPTHTTTQDAHAAKDNDQASPQSFTGPSHTSESG